MNPHAPAALAILTLGLLATPAHAASFDCAKAGTAVEKTICGDAELSKLDELLGDRYVRARAKTDDAKALRTEQRAWLRETRNACPDDACLKTAYEARIAALTKIGWMTDEKARAICEEVIALANGGSLRDRFLPAERATDDDLKVWSAANGTRYPQPYNVVRMDYDGDARIEVLGGINEGGVNSIFRKYEFLDIELNRKKTQQPYVPDDDMIWRQLLGTEQRLLWLSGEPIAVAGNLAGQVEWDRPSPRIVLVNWLAPTGRKFPLCHISEASVRTEIMSSQNPDLCAALKEGTVAPVDWSVLIDVVYGEPPDSGGRGFRSMRRGAALDLDLDGEPEVVTVTYYDYGGSQPRRYYIPYLTLVKASSQSADVLSQINGTPLSALNRRLEKTRDTEYGFPPALFQYEGKPYVLLGDGVVASFWNGERRDWCEFHVTSPYFVQQFISQESWPASARWEAEQTTGETQ